MTQLCLQQIQELLTSQGRRALAAAGEIRPPVAPAAIDRLRQAFPADLVSAALVLAGLRARARERFRRADGMYFDSADLLEQATSEPVARHKAERFVGLGMVADLCCGAGGDSLFVAERVDRLIAVDLSPARLLCLRANAENQAVAERVWPVASDVDAWVPPAEAYHIDPPRRDGGKRHLTPHDWQAWIDIVRRLAATHAHVAGKLSPAVDPTLLDWAGEVEFISENGTLKQAMAWCGRLARTRRSATVIRSHQGQTIAAETLASDAPVRTPQTAADLRAGQVLYEPDAAVVRAGLLGNLADRLGAGLVDSHLPLLTKTSESEPTLLARQYEVLERIDWSIKRVKQLLRARRWRIADIKTRAFASPPEQILSGLRGLKVPEDAPAVVLWAVRLGSRPVGIVTRRLAAPPAAATAGGPQS